MDVVYVVYAYRTEDPIAICRRLETAIDIVEGRRDMGYDEGDAPNLWYQAVTLEESKG